MDQEFIMGRIISFKLRDWKDSQTRTTHFIQFFTKGSLAKKMGYLNGKYAYSDWESKFSFQPAKIQIVT